jgi:hypothetical protein
MRAIEIPRVLSPGICPTKTGVTAEPRAFDVFPGIWRPLKEKWLACTIFESKQARPLTLAAYQEKRERHCITF